MPSIYAVDPSDVETFTVVTNPIRSYTSSSLHGSTGSVYLFPRHSLIQKDVQPDSSFVESAHDDADLSSLLRQVTFVAKSLRNPYFSVSVPFNGNFYCTFANGKLVGIQFPSAGDPALTPSSFVLSNPTSVTVSGTIYMKSGSTLLPGDGTYLSLIHGTISNAQLVASFPAIMQQYMNACAAQPQAARLKEVLDPQRFSPPPDFNSNTLRKLVIKDQLNTFYRSVYPTAHWAYTNYNSLNFFTASVVPSDSAILYPNIDGGKGLLVRHDGFCSGTYTPSGSFSFDFHINPRYSTDNPNGTFKAGTILHLSSTFCLSLVTGSSKDTNGRPVGFRLQLQLSSSADIPPSSLYQEPSSGDWYIASGTFGNQSASAHPSAYLVFQSNDNVLWQNHWHHVVVRWGTTYTNNGVGTFNVDGVDVGTFTVPLNQITPSLQDIVTFGSHSYGKIPGVTQDQPATLVLGNYYNGPNNSSNPQAAFFANQPALRDGLNNMWPIAGIETPATYAFDHPLNAELHDVAIRRCYMSDLDIATSTSVGPTFLDNTYALYVPPFFANQAP